MVDKRQVKEVDSDSPEVHEIYNGKFISVWAVDDTVYVELSTLTIHIPKEEWIEFKEELLKIGEL